MTQNGQPKWGRKEKVNTFYNVGWPPNNSTRSYHFGAQRRDPFTLYDMYSLDLIYNIRTK